MTWLGLPWKITPRERIASIAILIAVVAFGVILERRVAKAVFSPSDFPVYTRAAWQVRTGGDMYAITDEHGWHYVYPPLTAILLTPLAEPPSPRHSSLEPEPRPVNIEAPPTHHKHSREPPATSPTSTPATVPAQHHRPECALSPGFFVPRDVSVVIWYAVSIVLLTLGILSLAAALESHVPGLAVDPHSPGDRRIAWALRGLPILISLGAILTNLSRGQMEGVTLACVCFAVASLIRGKNFRAGLLLALPICIKIVPALLLIYPLLRLNFRCLAGAAVGLLLGLLIVPLIALGPQRTIFAYQRFTQVMILPSLGRGSDTSRQQELIQMSQGDTQSLMSVFQNTKYFNTPRDQRPPEPSPAISLAANLISLALLAITVAATGFRRRDPALAVALSIGCLLVVMLVATPVSHSHYWGLMAPMSMAMLAWEATEQKRRRAGMTISPIERQLRIAVWISLALCCAFDAIDRLPKIDKPMRDLGFATYCTLAAWAVAVLILRRVGPPALDEPSTK